MALSLSSISSIFTRPARTYHNLSPAALIEHAVGTGEGLLTDAGALSVTTGKYTGRSPKDKFIVSEPLVQDQVNWGAVNQPMAPEAFERLYNKTLEYLHARDLYIFDGYAGADPRYRMPIRIINEFAWQNLFVHQLFVRPTAGELAEHSPEFTVICMPGVTADPGADGTRSETFIAISFEHRLVLIGGTHYAGEMKKSIFSVLNYLLPQRGVFPMHCSANVGARGDVALFFGLSGTGKTTLSADSKRFLIGDDEHGWSDEGVFNFEGGCYAKCIDLTEEREPQIYRAIRFGSVLENVVVDPQSRTPDYASDELTENTRAAYPVEFIPGALLPGVSGHPEVIIFLTADAFGVLPPISRLTKEQAMYHFMSGYTSKLAGTERGVTSPEATFSACFGGPFLPLHASAYARMLGEKIDRHGARVYLLNTGWSGGPYGVGQRIKLSYTRAMVDAALSGALERAEFREDPIFRVQVPTALPGVPDEVLQPRQTWPDPEAYDRQAMELAVRFTRNFSKFRGVPDEIVAAGPRG